MPCLISRGLPQPNGLQEIVEGKNEDGFFETDQKVSCICNIP